VYVKIPGHDTEAVISDDPLDVNQDSSGLTDLTADYWLVL
jgi:hypothetical protein